MLSSGSASGFDKIIKTIKAVLENKYEMPQLEFDEEFNEEQYAEIEKVLDETAVKWKEIIDYASFEKMSMQDEHAKDDADAYDSPTRTLRIKAGFDAMLFQCQIKVTYPYDRLFSPFIAAVIKKNQVRSFTTAILVADHVITSMLTACQDLPDDTIFITLDNEQVISDQQAKLMLAILKKVQALEFGERSNDISESTAKDLVYSEFNDRMWVNGDGSYGRIFDHALTIKCLDIGKIFLEGVVCESKEIEFLAAGLTGLERFRECKIYNGKYAGKNWENFFSVTLGAKSRVQALYIGVSSKWQHDLVFSQDVLVAIFTALQFNTKVRNLRIAIPLSAVAFAALGHALKMNKSLQVIIFREMSLEAVPLKIMSDSLIANPNSRVEHLDFYGNRIGDGFAEVFGNLLTHFKPLLKLNLTATRVGYATCLAISKALKINSTLTELQLSHNYLLDTALLHLADAILVNDALDKLSLDGKQLFSENAVSSCLNCATQNTGLVVLTISSSNDLNKTKLKSIMSRNIAYALNNCVILFSDYTEIAIVLYRAQYQLKQKHVFTTVKKSVIDRILSFLFPLLGDIHGKPLSPERHNNLISENMISKKWKAQTASPDDDSAPVILFTAWQTLRSPQILSVIKADQISTVNLSRRFMDLHIAAKLAALLSNNISVNKLILSLCHITDEKFEIIGSAIKERITSLMVLNLEMNHLTSKSLPLLQELIVRGKVQTLILYKNNGLSDNPYMVTILTDLAHSMQQRVYFDSKIQRQANSFFSVNVAREAVGINGHVLAETQRLPFMLKG
jgi:hypothetical protein